MSCAVVTGSGGLVGSESVRFLVDRGFEVVGIDNDMRRYFFGDTASTRPVSEDLVRRYRAFTHEPCDIRDVEALRKIFTARGASVRLVIHTAGQPSHDWAAREPFIDFSINATGTLNLLEAARLHCPEAVFIFMSTNKVYGDRPNDLPLRELATRWEVDPAHPYAERGIDESMSIDQCQHSLFGASKLAADVLVQEYGRCFGLRTGVFRGGCLTGPQHAGAELHGFLSYLMKCATAGRPYRIIGHQGKQVRDNLHSHDLVQAFYRFFEAPRTAGVYNIGGSRFSHCSLIEAIALCEEITGRPMKTSYEETPRPGDQRWWVSDVSKFQAHYPGWTPTRGIRDILTEMYAAYRAA